MPADFNRALQKLLLLEGGAADHPDDRGGRTKWGISEREFPDVNLDELTPADMAELYRTRYWLPLSCDKVIFQAVAQELFEQGVNFGIDAPARHCQRALNILRRDKVAVDGVVGPQTLGAIASLDDPAALIMLLNGFQLQKYIEIVEGDPSQRVFIRGWLKRVEMGRSL